MPSDLPTAEQVLAALSAELCPANLEVVRAADIHRTEDVIGSMRRHGGGLLIIVMKDQVVEPLVRNRFARHERDGDLEEVVSMGIVEGRLLLGRVPGSELRPKPRNLAPTAPDASLVALEEVDVEEIDIRRAARPCAGDGPGVDGADSDQGRLVALGAAVQAGRQVHPTVAGLAVYGRRPELWLPVRIELVRDGATCRLDGPIPVLVARAWEWGGWPPTAPRPLVRAMLADALAWRDWESPEAIVVRLAGSRVCMRVPGVASARQPAIARLMKREGLAADPARPFGRVDRWLTEQGLAASSRVRAESGLELVIDLPPMEDEPELKQRTEQTAPGGREAARVVLRAAGSNGDGATAPRDGEKPTVAVRLPDGASAVVEILEHGPATTTQLMTALGVSRHALRSALAILEATGRVRPELAARKSPFQRWLLVDSAAPVPGSS